MASEQPDRDDAAGAPDGGAALPVPHSPIPLKALPMPELRKDPIVGRWVIIATERAKRPAALKTEPLPPGAFCPFCEGSEANTPHEILAYRERGTRPGNGRAAARRDRAGRVGVPSVPLTVPVWQSTS